MGLLSRGEREGWDYYLEGKGGVGLLSRGEREGWDYYL